MRFLVRKGRSTNDISGKKYRWLKPLGTILAIACMLLRQNQKRYFIFQGRNIHVSIDREILI